MIWENVLNHGLINEKETAKERNKTQTILSDTLGNVILGGLET